MLIFKTTILHQQLSCVLSPWNSPQYSTQIYEYISLKDVLLHYQFVAKEVSNHHILETRHKNHPYLQTFFNRISIFHLNGHCLHRIVKNVIFPSFPWVLDILKMCNQSWCSGVFYEAGVFLYIIYHLKCYRMLQI